MNPSPEKQKLKKVKETGENRCKFYLYYSFPSWQKNCNILPSSVNWVNRFSQICEKNEHLPVAEKGDMGIKRT